MVPGRGFQRGFSLIELVFVIALAATLMTIAVPYLGDVSDSAKLNAAEREVERELQSARLKAVSVNRTLQVRLNCPDAGSYRTVEVIGQGSAADTATNRCSTGAYPFPAPDTDVMTRPNYDGPVRLLPEGATVTSANIEFHSDGTAAQVVSNVAQAIETQVTVTVTRKGKSKSVTVNGAGKIQLQ
jgi:prepilin-type N-terminal cleavage/methylation domain-containing protein